MHTRKYKYKHERKTGKSYFRSTSKIIMPRSTLGNRTTSSPEAMRLLVSWCSACQLQCLPVLHTSSLFIPYIVNEKIAIRRDKFVSLFNKLSQRHDSRSSLSLDFFLEVFLLHYWPTCTDHSASHLTNHDRLLEIYMCGKQRWPRIRSYWLLKIVKRMLGCLLLFS